MVEFEEIKDERTGVSNDSHSTAASKSHVSSSSSSSSTPEGQPEEAIVEDVIPQSQERLLDAECIEKAAEQVDRPTAKMHLEALAKKLRKEAQALKMVEASKAKAAESPKTTTAAAATTTTTSPTVSSSPPPAVKYVASSPSPAPAPVTPPPIAPTGHYTSVDRFSFDAGSYDSAFVTLYVPLPGVGSIPRDKITCNFTTTSFDLIVRELSGKSYRLFKDHLEKEITVDKSKIIIKADKVLIKLAKKKTEYGGYDFWNKLTDNKAKKKDSGVKDSNPQASIMELMKEMYEDGDDNMKKVIGEAMMKQRTGELDRDPMAGLKDGLDDF